VAGMPWRLQPAEYPGEFPTRLAGTSASGSRTHCVIPDRDHGGEPYKLTDEMWTFLAHHYRLREDAQVGQLAPAFTYRRSILVRPQKWGKGPLTAAIICAEALGPCVFDGYDAAGEPVGRPQSTPRIQIAATTDDQTDNVYGHLLPMIQRGPLADMIPDAGVTRINLPYGGWVEPVTSKATSRLGQPITLAIQDETGIWTKQNGGHALARTQRRGLAGMSGRSIETTNAWNPAELSVAQMGFESKVADIYRTIAAAGGPVLQEQGRAAPHPQDRLRRLVVGRPRRDRGRGCRDPDPPYWTTEGEAWALKHGERAVIPWETRRTTQMHLSGSSPT
jgi:hypothetical protein